MGDVGDVGDVGELGDGALIGAGVMPAVHDARRSRARSFGERPFGERTPNRSGEPDEKRRSRPAEPCGPFGERSDEKKEMLAVPFSTVTVPRTRWAE